LHDPRDATQTRGVAMGGQMGARVPGRRWWGGAKWSFRIDDKFWDTRGVDASVPTERGVGPGATGESRVGITCRGARRGLRLCELPPLYSTPTHSPGASTCSRVGVKGHKNVSLDNQRISTPHFCEIAFFCYLREI